MGQSFRFETNRQFSLPLRGNMNPTVLLALFLAVAAAAPGNVIQVDLNDQNHSQSGDAGNSVTGQYSFTDGDGVTHTIKYIADDKGYRVIGRSSVGAKSPAPVAKPIPAPAPKPVPAPVPAPAPAPVVLAAPVVAEPTPAVVNEQKVYYILGGSSGYGGSYGYFPQFYSGSHAVHGSSAPVVLVKECSCAKN